MATIGCDVEFFIAKQDGSVINPRVLKVPGTKTKPAVLREKVVIGDGNSLDAERLDRPTIQRDGLAVEIGIHPVKTPYHFVEAVVSARMHAQQYLKALAAMGGFEIAPSLSPKVSTYFPDAIVDTQGLELGCDPDYNAYRPAQDQMNVPFDPGRFFNNATMTHERFAGGHVHIGWDQTKTDVPLPVVAQLLDLMLGYRFMSAAMVRDRNGHQRRELFYGKPGTYRAKPYGIEYRSPSNSWAFTTRMMRQVGTQALALATVLETPEMLPALKRIHRAVPWEHLQRHFSSTELPAKSLEHKTIVDLRQQVVTMAETLNV